MNLDDIPGGSLCVVDTNVLLYAEQGVSSQAQRLIRRCASGELKGVLPQTVWQELTHKLMLAEAMMRGASPVMSKVTRDRNEYAATQIMNVAASAGIISFRFFCTKVSGKVRPACRAPGGRASIFGRYAGPQFFEK